APALAPIQCRCLRPCRCARRLQVPVRRRRLRRPQERRALPRPAPQLPRPLRPPEAPGVEVRVRPARRPATSRPLGRRARDVGGAEDRAYEAALKRGAADLGLGDSVVWTGMVVGAERWDAFAAGDVFALPSSNENFGIVVLEALLAGTPVVISDEVYIADELSAAGIAYVCGT